MIRINWWTIHTQTHVNKYINNTTSNSLPSSFSILVEMNCIASYGDEVVFSISGTISTSTLLENNVQEVKKFGISLDGIILKSNTTLIFIKINIILSWYNFSDFYIMYALNIFRIKHSTTLFFSQKNYFNVAKLKFGIKIQRKSRYQFMIERNF